MTVPAATVTQYYTGIFRQAPSAAVATAYGAMSDAATALGSMIAAANLQVDPVVRLYQTAFNRVPDSAGMTAWVVPFSTGAITLQAIANGFTQSTEFTTLYPTSMSNAQYVGALYQNILQRNGEDAGIKSWTDALNSGALTRAQVLLGFSESAEFVKNVSTNVDAFLTQCANNTETYTGSLFNQGGSSTVQNFTINADNLIGGAGNDVFAGIVQIDALGQDQSTLQSFDSVTGGTGTDTLSVQLKTDYFGGAQISGVENLVITPSSVPYLSSLIGGEDVLFNATGITGLQNVAINGGIGGADITALSNVVNMAVSNTLASYLSVGYTTAATAGTADASTLTINNVGNLGLFIETGIDTGAAVTNGLETLAIKSSGVVPTGLDVDSDADQTSLSTITLAASNEFYLSLLGQTQLTAKTIDASASTANVDIDGFGAVANTVTGGTGNDIFRFGANFASTDVVNGGTGTDTLSANGSTLAGIVAIDANISNIETLMIADDVGSTATAINAGFFGAAPTVTNVRIESQATIGTTDAASNITVSGLVAATDVNNVRLDGLSTLGGVYTFGITGATNPGTANSVAIDIRGFANTGGVAELAVKGVETLSITNAKADYIPTAGSVNTMLLQITDTQLTSLTLSGSIGMDLSKAALAGGVNTVNASGMTAIDTDRLATTKIVMSQTATTGVNFTGGSGADDFYGSNLKDIIVTGSGADSVWASAGGDKITFGSGKDVFNIGDVSATAASAAVIGNNGSNMVAITDFTSGTDKIGIQAYALTGVTATSGTVVNVAPVITDANAVNSATDVWTQLASLLTSTNFVASSATTVTGQLVSFTNGAAAGTYLVINDATAGWTPSTDVVINVTGVSGTIIGTDFKFYA